MTAASEPPSPLANRFDSVLVTGGGGYVGSALVPALLARGHRVRAADTFWFGRDVFPDCAGHPRLEAVECDIRDRPHLPALMDGIDAVIHLACVSNDPSFDLDPAFGRSVNFDAFGDLLEAARAAGVKRFIYASSSSVYGVRDEPHVTEDMDLQPLTDYAKYKAACEEALAAFTPRAGFDAVIVRPSTLCGCAPRLRLDLTVNILTVHALVNRAIRVFGGKQLRPHLNVHDMVRFYELLLDAPASTIAGEVFNVGFENQPVEHTARLVRETLGDTGIDIRVEPTNDPRSYHVCADKARDVLGFDTRHTVADAIRELADVYRAGGLDQPLTNPRYHNILRMKQVLAGA